MNNTTLVISMLNDYLELLQQSNADDDKITQVKLMIWSIQDDIKLQKFLNNLTISNQYYKR